MLAFQASGTGSIPVRCIIFFFLVLFVPHGRPSTWCSVCVQHSLSHSPFRHCSISMRHPQLKRRRLSSNFLIPLLTPNLLVASLKPSSISTCNSCHRTIKSSPPLVCARFVVPPFAMMAYDSLPSRPHRRCSASTCTICVRTCTGPLPSSRGTGTRDPSPHQVLTPPPLSNPGAPSPSRRRRPRDEDIDTFLTVIEAEREGSGCGRMICRICCSEILQRWMHLTSWKSSFFSLFVTERSETVTCLDCLAAPHAPPAHNSDGSMQETITDNISTVST